MTIEELVTEKDLINNETEIIIRDELFRVVARGNWFQDRVLDYMEREIDSLTYEPDENKLYIDPKEEGDAE